MMVQIQLINTIFVSEMPDSSFNYGIPAVGMLTVFIGLLSLALLLPLLRNFIESSKKKAERKEKEQPGFSLKVKHNLSPEEIAAITAAIHAYLCQLDQLEQMALTWRMYEKPFRPWRIAGRAETLQGFNSILNRDRRR
jgi:sodium pump decarboxylase gamma subunit